MVACDSCSYGSEDSYRATAIPNILMVIGLETWRAEG